MESEMGKPCGCRTLIYAIRFFGAALLLLVLVITFVQPTEPASQNPGKLQTTIMGLELSESISEFEFLLGKPHTDIGQKYRKAFILGSWIDFGFMLAYNGFLLALGLWFYRGGFLTTLRMWIYGFLVFLILFADIGENIILLKILKGNHDQIFASIPLLQLFSYFKWEALGLVSAILSFSFILMGKRTISFIFAMSFFFAVGGLYMRESMEFHSMFMAIGWIIAWYRSLPFPNAWIRMGEEPRQEN